MGELYPMANKDRREDNATPEDAHPVHEDGKTEQELMNEAKESGTKRSDRAVSKKA